LDLVGQRRRPRRVPETHVESHQNEPQYRRLALPLEGVRQAHRAPRVTTDEAQGDLEVFDGRPDPPVGEVGQTQETMRGLVVGSPTNLRA
jgi:hypothetical protein